MTLSDRQFDRLMRDIGATEPQVSNTSERSCEQRVIVVEDCDGNAVLMVTLDDHLRIVQRWHDRADRYYSAYRRSWKAVAYAYAAASMFAAIALVGWLS